VRLGASKTRDITVRIPLNRQPDLYPWFQSIPDGQVERRDCQLFVTDVRSGDLFSMTVHKAWLSRYAITPTQDGGVLEDYDITSDDMTRP
jgi:hypothetical protein